LGYLFTVTIYKFKITATILITNILLIWRVQFMEIECHGGTQVKWGWEPLIYANQKWTFSKEITTNAKNASKHKTVIV
jgi:hypothetical protein